MPGGIYLANGVVVSEGKHVWDFLLDPVTPTPCMYKFQGIQELPDELYPPDFDRISGIILMDMVSEHDYTPPDFVEEVKRLGLSRRVQKTFPFSRLDGKRGNIWLAMLHWRAKLTYDHANAGLAYVKYRKCPWTALGETGVEHYPDCIFHLWYDLWRSKVAPDQTRVMPGFKYAPLAVIEEQDQVYATQMQMPWTRLEPAIFAVFPITHLEAVEFMPQDTTAGDCGVDILLCAK